MTRRPTRLAALALVSVLSGACESFQPEWVETLTLSPDSLHLSVGETATFEATPLSERGAELLDRAERVQWTLNSPIASLQANGGTGTITANALGSTQVTARLGRGVVRGSVYVQPPGLDRIAIVPDRVELSPGQRPRVESRLYDAQGNEMSPEGFRISWKLVDATIGFVGTPTGPSTDLLGRRIGATQLRLIVGDLSTSIPFIVR
jgi:hypothetical protein